MRLNNVKRDWVAGVSGEIAWAPDGEAQGEGGDLVAAPQRGAAARLAWRGGGP